MTNFCVSYNIALYKIMGEIVFIQFYQIIDLNEQQKKNPIFK
jgi:hypothetical protein